MVVGVCVCVYTHGKKGHRECSVRSGEGAGTADVNKSTGEVMQRKERLKIHEARVSGLIEVGA